MRNLIERQDAIRLAEQGQIQGFEWQFKKLCELPSAEPETKLIAEVKMSKEDIQSAVDEAVERIMAQPERKNGKWIGKEQFANSPEFYSWQCSVCGCVLEDPTLDKPYPFCPNCGSFNGEGEQSEIG